MGQSIFPSILGGIVSIEVVSDTIFTHQLIIIIIKAEFFDAISIGSVFIHTLPSRGKGSRMIDNLDFFTMVRFTLALFRF